MGRAKPLLPWGEVLLIEHQIQTLLKTGHPVVVVLGHRSDQILPVLEKYPVRASVNTLWEDGMGSSIAHGVSQMIEEFPEASGVLITQLDQPLLTISHFENMFGSFQEGSRQIVVSKSPSGWQGVPVLFDRVYFDELQSLSGDAGARKVFRSHPQALKVLECGDILDDMDTPETYQKLLGKITRP